MEWQTVVGLEIHVQLLTASKLFSGSSTRYGADPNTQTSFIDAALPGVLPVLNKKAVEFAIRLGLALGATINRESIFARKNYFYPDLPKGYQISQYEIPIVEHGSLAIGADKNIHVIRAHLEEDAGKSLHEAFHGMTGIDLNRAGTPLIEIVSAPEMYSAEEAVAYARAMHTLVRYLEICDGNMQEGSFRMDANVSVRPQGSDRLGTRCEIKNLNSFRFLERAILFEVKRQIAVLENGGSIVQETRLYDAAKDETRSMRTKEEANDYRYFPDPDLLPLRIEKAWIETIASRLPELPWQKKARYVELGITPYDADILVGDPNLAIYFEHVQKVVQDAKLVANWLIVELLAYLNKNNLDIEVSRVHAADFASLLLRLKDGTLSGRLAKEVLEKMWETGKTADAIIEEEGLKQVSDRGEIEQIIDAVLQENPKQLADYRAGKEKLFGYFVGQVMKKTQGKASPDLVNALLKEKL
jgi:aspartyl-tRNA(Asn)/glutamyl-tRNA(Gln) amidotransferase subunit B